MRPINDSTTSRRIGLTMGLVLLGGAACNNAASDDEDITTKQSALTPSTAPELDPTTIPRFQTNFQRFYSYAPTRNAAGQNEYTVQINTFTAQQLPSGFPQTTLFGYGGNVLTDPSGNPSLDGTGQIAFKRTSPGPKFEQTKGVPALIHYRNQLTGSHPLAVDPTLDWANPNNFPKPLPPFAPFPPGYPQAQSPITHTTHTHGIEVRPGVRRHARHVVHGGRHPRPGVRVERLHAAEQQPVGGVLVPRPRVRRDPPGRGHGPVGVLDPA